MSQAPIGRAFAIGIGAYAVLAAAALLGALVLFVDASVLATALADDGSDGDLARGRPRVFVKYQDTAEGGRSGIHPRKVLTFRGWTPISSHAPLSRRDAA
jgi:hypothetical protein